MEDLYVGLMSGTSLDGADGVLAAFPRDAGPGGASPGGLRILAHAWLGFEPAFRAKLLALNQPGSDELHRAALAANTLARLYADVVGQLLVQAGVTPAQVRAVGAHGQTVRHRPGEFDGVGYTLQLNAPALLAERCGIAVAADFRSRDVAAGGQGAPLVPAFHQAVFSRPDAPVAVLNIGGISNVTILPPLTQGASAAWGFDCGPGNVLMDLWCQQHRGQPYDAGGAWADQGRVIPALLQACLDEPFLRQPPPRSTGRDLFHAEWLQARLDGLPPMAPQDVQATLCEFTAQVNAQALQAHAPATRELLVCGGGAHNPSLMRRLAAALPGVGVKPSSDRGLAPNQVEAAAFAWLARALVRGEPGNLPSATGARGPRVLGCFYPA